VQLGCKDLLFYKTRILAVLWSILSERKTILSLALRSAKISRLFRRFRAHGLIAKIPRTRRWRVTIYRHGLWELRPTCEVTTSPRKYSPLAA